MSINKTKAKAKAASRTRAKRTAIVLRDQHRKPRLTHVRLIDTKPLIPVGKTVTEVEELVGLKDVELPDEHSLTETRKFFREQPSEAEGYALRGAQFPLRYGLYIKKVMEEEFGLAKLPGTIGAGAVSFFVQQFGDKERFERVFGNIQRKEIYWHLKKQKFCSRVATEVTPEAQFFYEYVARTYRGGRNEAYVAGFSDPVRHQVQYDWDLSGAYSTGLLIFSEPDYANAYISRNPEDYKGRVLGFVYADFEFPPETRFPCIQVCDSTYGLYFPLKGTSYFTAPELELALEMGAKINIRLGVIIPWANDERVFDPFVKKVRSKRIEFPKNSLENQLYKLMLNAIYGKCGQSLRNTVGFDTRTLGSKPIPPSRITNPYFASYVTGFIRAVLSELLWKIPDSEVVYSATTDGLLTTAGRAQLDISGTMCQRFQELVKRIDPKGEMLELKHGTRQILCAKTRAQFTIRPHEALPPVLAKGGVRPPAEEVDQNEYMVKLYLERFPGRMIDNSHLISTRDQWLSESDMITLSKERRLNLEYDFKRKPVNPRMVDSTYGSHLTFDTVPWSSVEEGRLSSDIV